MNMMVGGVPSIHAPTLSARVRRRRSPYPGSISREGHALHMPSPNTLASRSVQSYTNSCGTENNAHPQSDITQAPYHHVQRQRDEVEMHSRSDAHSDQQRQGEQESVKFGRVENDKSKPEGLNRFPNDGSFMERFSNGLQPQVATSASIEPQQPKRYSSHQLLLIRTAIPQAWVPTGFVVQRLPQPVQKGYVKQSRDNKKQKDAKQQNCKAGKNKKKKTKVSSEPPLCTTSALDASSETTAGTSASLQRFEAVMHATKDLVLDVRVADVHRESAERLAALH